MSTIVNLKAESTPTLATRCCTCRAATDVDQLQGVLL